MSFEPDYRNLVLAARNRRPPRLPFYEHSFGYGTMEAIIGKPFSSLIKGGAGDVLEFFRLHNGFFRDHGYDTVSYEAGVARILPGGGALQGKRPAAIRTRSDYDAYPWGDLPALFWEGARPRFEALSRTLPPGMKVVGGIGNGVFEISEDLVGYEDLCLMMVDDPGLFADLYVRIGDLLLELWTELLARYGEIFAVCRIGDDMGFKSAPLMAPATLREYVVPQYARLADCIHKSGHPFLLHSCGCIFDVMDDLIAAGVDAKHSNEDAIAPFDEWIGRYGDRIGLFGGIDTDRLCRMTPDALYDFVLEEAGRFRRTARGYALGSGNSIPGYVPIEGFLAMNRAGRMLREQEGR